MTLKASQSVYKTRVREFLGIKGDETFDQLSKEQKGKLGKILDQFSAEIDPTKEAKAKILDYFLNMEKLLSLKIRANKIRRLRYRFN